MDTHSTFHFGWVSTFFQPIERLVLRLPAYGVRVVRPGNTRLQLPYGNESLDAPRYDLALVARTILDSPAAPAIVGPEGPAAPPLPTGVIFWSALVLAVVALLALIWRLLAKS